MPRMALTDLAVRSLPEGVYLDSKLPAFGVRIGKRRKTWFITKTQRRLTITIGHYPSMSLAEARRRAHIEMGTPTHPQAAPRFTDALNEFLEQDHWRPRTKREITRILKRHFRWSRRLDQITHTDVLQAIEAIEKPSEAAHAFKDLRSFFNWCVPRYLPTSPMQGLKPPHRYIPRERVLSHNELGAIWAACETQGNYGTLVRLLILTGQRVGQFLPFSKDWIVGDTLVFPSSVMKGKKEHILPITPHMEPLLQSLEPMLYQGKPKARLDKESGITDWTIHDLRRSLSSGMASLKVPLHLTELILAHQGTISGVAAIYNRYHFLPEMREALERYHLHLLGSRAC